jgi:arginine repressor
MFRDVAMRPKRVQKKVETMYKIAFCLPVPSYEILLRKLTENKCGVTSKATISKVLKELKELGVAKKTMCSLCGHEIYELVPSQRLVIEKRDGTKEECTLDMKRESDFLLFIFGKKEWECERRSMGKKPENVRKKFTITTS